MDDGGGGGSDVRGGAGVQKIREFLKRLVVGATVFFFFAAN